MARPRYFTQKLRDLAYGSLMSRLVLRPRLHLSREELQEHQKRRLAMVLNYAKKRSPFYARTLKDIDLKTAHLRDLPILTKATMMEQFDDLVTDPRLKRKQLEEHLDHLMHDCYYQNRYKVFRSGGSSKHPAIMVYRWQEFSWILAQILRSTHGSVKIPRKRRLRGANIYARTPTHDSIRISQSFQVGFHQVRDFPVDMPLKDLVSELNLYQPDVLSGYPSIISELAHEKLKNHLTVRPQMIFLGSEPLSPSMRKTITKAFGIEPHDHYGTTEAVVMATECPAHHGMHLEEDMHIIEIVGENNEPVKPGEEGYKALITNLYAFTQPIIRYELSDMMVLEPDEGPCACGSSFRRLRQVTGRNEDLFYFQTTGKHRVVIKHDALRAAMDQCSNIRQYQIIQRNHEILVKAFLVNRREENRSRDEIIKVLSTLLQGAGIKISRISCQFVDEMERVPQASQKFRQIFCEAR